MNYGSPSLSPTTLPIRDRRLLGNEREDAAGQQNPGDQHCTGNCDRHRRSADAKSLSAADGQQASFFLAEHSQQLVEHFRGENHREREDEDRPFNGAESEHKGCGSDHGSHEEVDGKRAVAAHPLPDTMFGITQALLPLRARTC